MAAFQCMVLVRLCGSPCMSVHAQNFTLPLYKFQNHMSISGQLQYRCKRIAILSGCTGPLNCVCSVSVLLLFSMESHIPAVLKLTFTICFLKFQAICIQQKILHSHDDKSFIITPRLLSSIDNDNFLE